MSKKKIINYPGNYYECNVVINGRWFVELGISQYYKTKLERSIINDEIIQELVKQLHGIEKVKNKSGYYDHEPLYIGYRSYNLVWDYDESPFNTTLLIINCHRESKYDKK